MENVLNREAFCSSLGNFSLPPSYDVVIGILSARGNTEQRQALRETWVGHALQHPSLGQRYIGEVIFVFLIIISLIFQMAYWYMHS